MQLAVKLEACDSFIYSISMPRTVLRAAQDHAAEGTRAACQQREQQSRTGDAAAHCNAWRIAWDATGVC